MEKIIRLSLAIGLVFTTTLSFGQSKNKGVTRTPAPKHAKMEVRHNTSEQSAKEKKPVTKANEYSEKSEIKRPMRRPVQKQKSNGDTSQPTKKERRNKKSK